MCGLTPSPLLFLAMAAMFIIGSKICAGNPMEQSDQVWLESMWLFQKAFL